MGKIKNENVYTRADWARDRYITPEIGQVVEDSIIEELVGIVPPWYYANNIFQFGETQYHVGGTAYYKTFERENGKWIYTGVLEAI